MNAHPHTSSRITAFGNSHTHAPVHHRYAADVVHALKAVCAKHQLRVPTIISESGRAVSSHETVLVFSVLHATQVCG
jgi:arginine decarboxylase-like protein